MIKNIIILILVLGSLVVQPQSLNAGDEVIKTQEQYIQEIFGAKAKIATAVLKHESGMKLDAVNYNCRYDNRSTFCKKGDTAKAWSVDCSIAQINVNTSSISLQYNNIFDTLFGLSILVDLHILWIHDILD